VGGAESPVRAESRELVPPAKRSIVAWPVWRRVDSRGLSERLADFRGMGSRGSGRRGIGSRATVSGGSGSRGSDSDSSTVTRMYVRPVDGSPVGGSSMGGSSMGGGSVGGGPVGGRPVGGGPIDITPGAAAVANGGGWLSRRQVRFAVLAAAVAVMVAGGVAYAALNQPGTTAAGPSHNTPVKLWPSGDSFLPGGGLLPPGAVPVVPASPNASAATPSTTPSSGTPAGAVPATTLPAGRTASPSTRHPTTPAGGPTSTGAPPGSGPDPGGPPPEVDASTLTATFTQDGRSGPNGISHFSGTVEVDNPGRRPASGWQVTMRIRGANPVHGDGSIDVSQNGAQVTFTPYGDSVPAGGSVTFTFTVSGVMAAAPSGCAINGQACN
jgi:hypothetical protein